jgi:undecaprenyl-diphosphatase
MPMPRALDDANEDPAFSPGPPMTAPDRSAARSAAPHRRVGPWTFAWSAAVGAIVFAATALAVLTGAAQPVDLSLLDALRAPGLPDRLSGPPWLADAAVGLNALAAPRTIGLLSALVVSWLVVRRAWRSAALAAAGPVGALAIAQALKHGFARARPPLEYRAIEAHGASFPSVQTMLATAAVMTLAILVARATRRPALRAGVLALAMLAAILIGSCRVYLGVHWASDVIAAWGASAAWTMACVLAALAPRSKGANLRRITACSRRPTP